MEQSEIISMARELASRHGSRMCDENGETHGEELYCVGVEDIAEIIKQVAAHEREACAKECDYWAEQAEARGYTCKGETHIDGFGDGASACAAAIRARGNDASS